MKTMMKVYYLLVFVFLAAMMVMWVPQLFIGLLIFAAVIGLIGVIAWFWFKHKMKKMGLDLGSTMQQQMMGQMGKKGAPGQAGQQGQPAGADLLSQLMAQMQNGGMAGPGMGGPGVGGMGPMGGPDPAHRPRPVSRPTDGPVIYVKPEEIDDED